MWYSFMGRMINQVCQKLSAPLLLIDWSIDRYYLQYLRKNWRRFHCAFNNRFPSFWNCDLVVNPFIALIRYHYSVVFTDFYLQLNVSIPFILPVNRVLNSHLCMCFCSQTLGTSEEPAPCTTLKITRVTFYWKVCTLPLICIISLFFLPILDISSRLN